MFSSKLKFILGLILFSSCHLMMAQDALLWRISGKGLKKPSYLFGTIHIYCHTTELNKPILGNCIDSCDIVALELNLYDYDTRVALLKSQMETVNRSISSQLNVRQKQLLDSTCRALLGDSLNVFDMKTPMNLMMSLYTSEKILGCQTPEMVDMFIATMAYNKGKEQFGLESFGFQDSLLKSISDSMQIKMLMDFCKNIDSARSEFETMTKLYREQKLLALSQMMISTSPELMIFKKELLDDRNARWVQFLKDNMAEAGIFMAVGSAHLGGSEGLIEALRKAGYTVTPIIIK